MTVNPGSARPCTVDDVVARYKDDDVFAAALRRPLTAQEDLYAQMVVSEMRIHSARHEAELAELTRQLQQTDAPVTVLIRARAYYSAHCLSPSPSAENMSPLALKASESVREWARWTD